MEHIDTKKLRFQATNQLYKFIRIRSRKWDIVGKPLSVIPTLMYEIIIYKKNVQIEKLNSRLRAAKRTADEAEEETTRVNGLKRKTQRDLDEANEQIEALQRELQNQRNKAR